MFFGANAKLDINGSFVGSTANGIEQVEKILIINSNSIGC
ncbi:MAG: hypothetical protein AAGG00_18085 [Cyanobacteria bacterium P01_H01_bin.150]